jgi:hypothetical protein
MNRTTNSTFPFLLFLAVITLLSVREIYGQTVSVRATAGAAYMPMSGWMDFWKNFSSFYQRQNPNPCYALSVHYRLSPEHSLSLGTELLRSSASLTEEFGTILWDFQGIPLTLGYEYTVWTSRETFSVSAGAGASYYFSKISASLHPPLLPEGNAIERNGNGYGFHLSAALISNFSKSFGMIAQVRARYADGMAFSSENGDAKVEFTGCDASVGIVWNVGK